MHTHYKNHQSKKCTDITHTHARAHANKKTNTNNNVYNVVRADFEFLLRE